MGQPARSRLRKFVCDQRGATLILFSIMLPAVFGLVALAADASRYMMLNTELQDMVDAAALAAAKSLKGTTTSMDEAVTAGNAVFNNPKWSSTALADGAVTRTYVFTDMLGALTFAPDDQKKARFVKVTATPRSFTGTLIAAVTPNTTITTSAKATAGSSVVACKVPPVMICAPNGDVANLPYALQIGMLYRLKGGGGAGYDDVPGAFGLLDTPGRTSSGTNEIRDNLAEEDPNFCFLSAMSRRNGNAAAIRTGINVRFDMYSNQMTDFPPAPNTTKRYVWNGKTGGNCGYDYDASGTAALGLSNGATETQDVAMGPQLSGNTNWDRAAYWAANHAAKGAMPAALANATRYEMYLWELSLHPTYSNSAYPAQMPTASEPTPRCWTGAAVPNTDAKRRVMHAAVLDCSGNQAQISLSTQYLKFFITEPATTQGDVFAEYIGKEELGNNSGVLHHIVQLYR